MPGCSLCMGLEVQGQCVYMDCTATSLSNASPRASLTAPCEAIRTNVHSELCYLSLGYPWQGMHNCNLSAQHECPLGEGADCFYGNQQYCPTFSLAHETEERAQRSQVAGQCYSVSKSRLCQSGVVCRERDKGGKTLGTGTMGTKYS